MPSATKQTKLKAGVIGDPINHSLSPVLHNFWLKKYGIDGSYEAIHVTPEALPYFIKSLDVEGFQGINITLPHKENAVALMDNNYSIVDSIGAVNTVVISDSNTIEGRNTDWFGFTQNLKQHAPDWNGGTSKALVLGAGGAAKAIIMGLLIEGCTDITLTNRTLQRAEILAEDLNVAQNKMKIKVVDWELRSESCADCNLLINTTQLGMKNQPPLDINLSKLSNDAIVNDIVYNPLKTDLLEAAEARGLTSIDGLGMLLWQAQPGFEAWFGVKPEVDDELREHVIAAMGQGA